MTDHHTEERPHAQSEPLQPPPGAATPPAPDSNGYMWLGVILVLLGVLALVFPLISTLTVTFVVGIAILAAGLVKLWRAFLARPLGRALLNGVWGLLYILAGALILAAPLTGAISLTIVLGALFVLGGAASIAWALTRPLVPSWGWMLASGVVSILLGVLVIFALPLAALWMPGLVVGVDLVVKGAAFIAIDRSAARARTATPA